VAAAAAAAEDEASVSDSNSESGESNASSTSSLEEEASSAVELSGSEGHALSFPEASEPEAEPEAKEAAADEEPSAVSVDAPEQSFDDQEDIDADVLAALPALTAALARVGEASVVPAATAAIAASGAIDLLDVLTVARAAQGASGLQPELARLGRSVATAANAALQALDAIAETGRRRLEQLQAAVAALPKEETEDRIQATLGGLNRVRAQQLRLYRNFCAGCHAIPALRPFATFAVARAGQVAVEPASLGRDPNPSADVLAAYAEETHEKICWRTLLQPILKDFGPAAVASVVAGALARLLETVNAEFGPAPSSATGWAFSDEDYPSPLTPEQAADATLVATSDDAVLRATRVQDTVAELAKLLSAHFMLGPGRAVLDLLLVQGAALCLRPNAEAVAESEMLRPGSGVYAAFAEKAGAKLCTSLAPKFAARLVLAAEEAGVCTPGASAASSRTQLETALAEMEEQGIFPLDVSADRLAQLGNGLLFAAFLRAGGKHEARPKATKTTKAAPKRKPAEAVVAAPSRPRRAARSPPPPSLPSESESESSPTPSSEAASEVVPAPRRSALPRTAAGSKRPQAAAQPAPLQAKRNQRPAAPPASRTPQHSAEDEDFASATESFDAAPDRSTAHLTRTALPASPESPPSHYGAASVDMNSLLGLSAPPEAAYATPPATQDVLIDDFDNNGVGGLDEDDGTQDVSMDGPAFGW
jgi:hypothetical protein